MEKRRIFFYHKNYFREFYSQQTEQVRGKIDRPLDLIENLSPIPEQYFKHLSGTDSLYEIRVQTGVIYFASSPSLIKTELL
jgi:hypothetical protein